MALFVVLSASRLHIGFAHQFACLPVCTPASLHACQYARSLSFAPVLCSALGLHTPTGPRAPKCRCPLKEILPPKPIRAAQKSQLIEPARLRPVRTLRIHTASLKDSAIARHRHVSDAYQENVRIRRAGER
jgi:hypothetical protein